MKLDSADAVLESPFPGFDTPLEIAREWLYSGEDCRRQQALLLLVGLEQRYPHAPQIGQVLVLALIDLGQFDEARLKLLDVERRFRNPDEETLARWGRLFREQGEQALVNAETKDDYRRIAVEHFRQSLKKYREAYEVRESHFPLVNCAELLLTIASLDDSDRDENLENSRSLARQLLQSRPNWPDAMPDDNIWHLATEAHGHLLLQEWEFAAEKYREAENQKTVGHSIWPACAKDASAQ